MQPSYAWPVYSDGCTVQDREWIIHAKVTHQSPGEFRDAQILANRIEFPLYRDIDQENVDTSISVGLETGQSAMIRPE